MAGKMMASKNGGGTFTPCPAGTHLAVVVDITPLQKRDTNYGPKEQFRIVLETATMNPETKKRYCVWSQWLTLNLGEKSNLRKIVKGLLNRDLTAAEEDGFDVESLLGMSTQLLIAHDHDGDKVFAHIAGFIPAPAPVAPSGEYKRTIDRDQSAATTSQQKPQNLKAAPLQNDPSAAFAGAEAWKGHVIHVGKNTGAMVADLGPDQVHGLLSKWWPSVMASPTEQDSKLHDALLLAQKTIDDMVY